MGVIILTQGTPILWYAKHQNTIKSFTFSSEFVALKIATELNKALRFKLLELTLREPHVASVTT